ncbi:MAG: protein translocase subunit SecD [candidate division WOR-3 bacterium]|nr:protein translocase subunit SecD [candidate division WOR-3 bacterium]
MKTLNIRLIIVLIVIGISIYFLLPTIQYYTLSDIQKQFMPREKFRELKSKSLNLGLDLQGGMYLVLQVEQPRERTTENIADIVERTVFVIKNRIDNLGIAEPIVQKIGNERIMVQLPGVLDRERAREIIGRTAQLEFRLVAEPQILEATLNRIDRYLLGEDTLKQDTLKDTLMLNRPFSSMLINYGGDMAIMEENIDSIKKLLSRSDIKQLIPRGYEFFFGNLEVSGNTKFRRLYLLRDRSELTGAYLINAVATVGGDQFNPNAPVVSLEFNPQGAMRFANITSSHVGKRLAIVLDSFVYSAPQIREAILGGRAQITGIPNMQEAKDLSNILKAGALPAPVRILEERSVGPTLGKDSIERGTKAIIFGYLFVLVFMMIYYRLGGFITVLIQALNFLIILSILSLLGATLTLPGMAGLILTVGFAIDANVLIFERIREEMRNGKDFITAIEYGYKNASRAIWDTNILHFLAALVLTFFGSGPVKGFAVILAIGVITSLFTAVFVSRLIFDLLVYKLNVRYIPI